jgi:hypothetical protein
MGAFCAYLDRCADDLGPIFASAADCERWMPLQLTETCSPIEFTNPDEDVDACVAWLDALECGPSPFATNAAGFNNGPCGILQAATPGLSGEGEECVLSECSYGLYCDADADPCPVCEPVQRNGQVCGSSEECAVDLYCDVNTCRPRQAVDAACVDNRDCAAGLFCDTDTCKNLLADGSTCPNDDVCLSGWCNIDTCAALIAVGESCTASTKCAGHAVCIDNACSPRRAAGSACADDGECLAGNGCLDNLCVAPAICGEGAEGDICINDESCASSLYCDRATYTCAPRSDIDGPCPGSNECREGLFCWTDDSCQPLVQLGDSCASDYVCAAPNSCDSTSETCTAPLPNGAECSGWRQCASGFCDGFGSIPPQCADPPVCPAI